MGILRFAVMVVRKVEGAEKTSMLVAAVHVWRILALSFFYFYVDSMQA